VSHEIYPAKVDQLKIFDDQKSKKRFAVNFSFYLSDYHYSDLNMDISHIKNYKNVQIQKISS